MTDLAIHFPSLHTKFPAYQLLTCTLIKFTCYIRIMNRYFICITHFPIHHRLMTRMMMRLMKNPDFVVTVVSMLCQNFLTMIKHSFLKNPTSSQLVTWQTKRISKYMLLFTKLSTFKKHENNCS